MADSDSEEKKKCQLDDIFSDHIGELGCYQIWMFFLLGIMAFTGTELIYTNFTALDVPHVCHVPQLENLTFEQQQYIVAPLDTKDGSSSYSQCNLFSFNYSNFDQADFLHWNRTEALSRYHPKTAACSSYTFNDKVFKHSIVQEWRLVCGQRWYIDLVSTITVAGCFIGALLGGSLADKYGRKRGLLACNIVKLVGNIAAIFAPDYYLFCAARALVGFGSTSTYLIAFVLLVELVGSSYRNTVGIGFSILYSLGFMYIPLAAYVTKDAFTFQIAVVAPMLLSISYFCLLPESPRWLLLNERRPEALKVLRVVGKCNGRPLSPGFDMDNVVSVASSSRTQEKSTICDIFATPVIRMRSLILCFDWFTVSLIFYALSLNAGNLVGNVYLNTFLLGVVEIPAGLIAIWSVNVNAIGRRWTHVIAFLVAGLSLLACVPVIETRKVLMLSTVFAMIGKSGSAAAFNGLYLYTSELYPTQVRNLGMGVCSAMARISGMVASYAGGSLQQVWPPFPSLLFGTLGTLSAIATIKLPETLHTTLPETIAQVEDQLFPARKHLQDDIERAPLLADDA